MLLSGFTFIRNAKKYDFPILECIESMLPIVDELVVNVGKSDDGTEELIAGIKSPKIKIVNSVWDDAKTESGLVLSEQTNIALDACQGRWALYLQADEAIHESEHAYIRAQVEEADRSGSQSFHGSTIDGFKFRYLHFYGGYSLVQRPWNWYPSEIRIVRRESRLRSFGDAQTFKAEGGDAFTPLLNAHVFHYGHARHPDMMAKKITYFHRFWHGDEHGIQTKQVYQLERRNLTWYWGTHPAAYGTRVAQGQEWSPQPSKLVPTAFERVVIFTDRAHMALAQELMALIEANKRDGLHVELVEGMRAWMKSYFAGTFTRQQSALVDLTAESRGAWNFVFWVWDALSAFSWRVAHAPQGTLSKFRARFFTAVNWGAHEKTTEGFHVPPAEHAKQLARWLGFDL